MQKVALLTRPQSIHERPPLAGGGRLCERYAPRRTACGRPARLTRFTARFTGLRFVDREGTATKLFALEPLNGGSSRLTVRHLNEAKPTRATRIAVGYEINLVHNSILLKELAEVMVRRTVRQIANKNV